MTDSETIDVGEIDGYVWVHVKGKGSFAGSPPLKDYLDRRINEGEKRFVVDLEACPAMDSTFMGTLAGVAMRLGRVPGGRLQLNAVNERNREALEDLGLDVLLDIDPNESEWRDHVETVRSRLEPLEEESGAADAEHVLEAHRRLCEVNRQNVDKFGTVMDVLEQRVTGEQ